MEMEKDMHQRVEHYLLLWQQLTAQVSELAATVLIAEIGKDRRGEQLAAQRTAANGNGDGPATEKQRNYLQRLGVEVPDTLSKSQASAMIDAARQ